MGTITRKLILASLLLATAMLAAGSGLAAPLYFPHVDTNPPWQTEIAIINAGEQPVSGTLRALSNAGQLVESKAVTLPAHARRQITVAAEFANHTTIGYIVFDSSSTALQGYTKFSQAGVYRAAIPAVKEVNTANIYVSHIDSSSLWWTGLSLVNTTATAKNLTITFNTGQSKPISLAANEHKAFDIASLFNGQPQPDIKSAVITNAGGVIGLELFGSSGGGNQLDGLLLTDSTASTLYYPHVASDALWWTGIVAYNPSEAPCTITVTPYTSQGAPLAPANLPIAGKEKYVGLVSGLNLPPGTAWFRIDSTSPLSGFELFATWDGKQLAAYAGKGGGKAGVFPKVEKNGWTGIAFVNTEAGDASVMLTAYNDNGNAVATWAIALGGYAKVVNYAEAIFPQDISSATYIAYSSDRDVVGFQLNGSSDGMMLDGLPGLSGPTGSSAGYIQDLFAAYKVGTTLRYEESFTQGNPGIITVTLTGTRDINGVACLDFRIDEEGQPLMHAYVTVNDASGGLIHALGSAAGAITDTATPPVQFLPANPPVDFATTTTIFPLSGQYNGRVVTTAATVTTPLRTYNNAVQVELIRQGTAITGVDSVTMWIVPNVGIVRGEWSYATVGLGVITFVLTSFTPAP